MLRPVEGQYGQEGSPEISRLGGFGSRYGDGEAGSREAGIMFLSYDFELSFPSLQGLVRESSLQAPNLGVGR